MASELLRALFAVSVVAGAIIMLILTLRAPLRRVFGAQLAYLIWSAVPAGLLLALLPIAPIPGQTLQVAAPFHQLAGFNPPGMAPGAAQWPQWLLTIWVSGAVAMMLRTWRAHMNYLNHATIGPAVIGLYRPRVVVPRDFTTRYTPQEQRLILAHEHAHIRRRDPLFNCLCALIQCGLWFHPLVHFAARRFRLDQELACDAAVMSSYPSLKRSYADAMLKTQLSTQGTLIYCHWQSIHPLKERIMQLQQTPPQGLRKFWGRLVITAFIGTCGFGGMSAHADVEQPGKSGQFQIKMKLTVNGESSTPTVRVQEGVPFSVVSKGAHGVWRSEFVLKAEGDSSVFLKTVVKHDDRIIGSPALQVAIGEPAAVAIKGDSSADDFKLQLTVTPIEP
jgi:beta-lactamase regulating signal transducer with metallopeptidase domain